MGRHRFERIFNSSKALFTEYLEHSTIHGIKYIAEKNRSWLERTLWLAIFCVSLSICGKLMYDAWHIHPIIISFSGKPTPVWQIPFPSVNVCPTILARKEKLNITDVLKRLRHGTPFNDLSEIEQTRSGAISTFCFAMTNHNLGNLTSCRNCLETIRDIRIPPEEIFVKCQFNNELFDCIDSFEEIIMSRSVCYNFNGLDVYRQKVANKQLKMWSLDNGYDPGSALNTYPHRGTAAGIRLGFSVVLKLEKKNYDYECGNPGFTISFQMPNEFTPYIKDELEIGMKQSVVIVVKPKIMTTSDELRDHPIEERNCYYSDERKLRFFTEYTQYNCEHDCAANATLEHCGCVTLNYPEQPGIQSCGPGMIKCFSYISSLYVKDEIKDCKCLPGCNSIQYEKQVFMHDLKMTNAAHGIASEDFEYTQLTVYFKENEFITSQRSLLYGQTEFYANCGGLLGLFLGISVISIIELFYFCTFRLLFNLMAGTNVFFNQKKPIPRSHESGSWLALTRKFIEDYLSNTTIQGFKYLIDSKRSPVERFWWLVVFVISLFCCGVLILEVFDRYDRAPIIVSFAETETPIIDIPFPAVTICSQTITKRESFDITQVYHLMKGHNISLNQLSEEDVLRLAAVAQVCDPELFRNIDPDKHTNCENCITDLQHLADALSMFLYFYTDFFHTASGMTLREVATEEGICFTYNAMPYYRNDDVDENVTWTLEDGYISNNISLTDSYPKKGSKHSLFMVLRSETGNYDFICKGPSQGYKVYLHLPIEAPQTSKNFYLVPLQQSVYLSIVPKMTLMASELRDYPVKKRQCYFNSERHLRFFKYYTQNNCESDCLANLTVTKCGCLRFNLPRIEGVKYCGIGEIQCHQALFQQADIHQLMSACDCLPGCTSLTYDAEIYQTYFFDTLPGYNMSQLTVSFKEAQFVAVQQSQLSGTTELIANCGGLLGLFLGFSFMSVLEIAYFGTVRLFCNIRMRVQRF